MREAIALEGCAPRLLLCDRRTRTHGYSDRMSAVLVRAEFLCGSLSTGLVRENNAPPVISPALKR